MAYERLSEQTKIATNLSTFIDSQMTLISQSRLRKNLEDESQFNRAVLEDNLTLDQQMKWRQDQLKRVTKGDKDERRRIKDEIATLKDLKTQQDFQDAYYEKVVSLNAGVSSLDSTLSWLNERLSKTTDQNIKKSIKDNISKLTALRYEQRKAALQTQTNYAVGDKTVEIVDKQIDKVNGVRSEALKAGNEEYVALLDMQLQSLNKVSNESAINKTMLDFSVATMTGQSATQLLNQFNTQISSADDGSPITIGDVNYESSKQFWDLKRADYLNDRSENGFFPRYQGELNEQVNYKSSRGILTNDSLTEVKNFYETLKDRAELTDYQDRIATDQQASLQGAADSRANSILNEFATKFDAKKAISDLAYMQDTFSVDQTLNYQKIVSSAAQEKEAQINQILSTMESLLKDNPGMNNQDALNQAVSAGAGATFSPEELATTKASDLITGAGEKATQQQFGESAPDITLPKDSTFKSAEIAEGELVKQGNSKTVYKMENGKLRAFTGAWNEDLLKEYSGKGFSSVKTVENISGIPTGQVIKTTDVQSATVPIQQFKEGELVKVANSSTVYKYEAGKLRSFAGAWKEDQFKKFTGQGFGAVKTVESIDKYEQGKAINPNDIN